MLYLNSKWVCHHCLGWRLGWEWGGQLWDSALISGAPRLAWSFHLNFLLWPAALARLTILSYLSSSTMQCECWATLSCLSFTVRQKCQMSSGSHSYRSLTPQKSWPCMAKTLLHPQIQTSTYLMETAATPSSMPPWEVLSFQVCQKSITLSSVQAGQQNWQSFLSLTNFISFHASLLYLRVWQDFSFMQIL